jgi:uncharacterized protein
MQDEAMAEQPRENETAAGAQGLAEVDPRLLEILVCPLTKSPLRYDRRAQELISDQAGLAYPILDGIPIMLVDKARPLADDERVPAGQPR